LNKSRTDQQVKVIRGGKEIQVNVTEVNVGDVIVLEQGDSIPADGLYIEGFNCNADESNMTGESDAIPKNEEKPFMSIFSRFHFHFHFQIVKLRKSC
jgi:Ca2+-transporting ATPase